METAQQPQNSHEILEELKETEKRNKADHLAPWQFKKGQSGNPEGRKPGKSLKEYAKEMLASMNEEERQEYLKGLPKEVIWKMSEGNPANATDLTSKGERILVMPPELINKNEPNPIAESNSAGQTQI